MLAAVLGLVVGLVVGGLGGGGGVLAVPALVYVLGQSAQDATTGSVVIVGITAVVGVLARVRGRSIDWRTGAVFGAVGVPAAVAGTWLNQRVAEPALLLAFAALTLIAAAALLLDAHATPVPEPGGGGVVVGAPPVSAVGAGARIAVGGVAVGFLTGFLGVGGGFLVVPFLVIGLRIPMNRAIGTSLLIITMNSVAALGTRAGGAELDWSLLVPFTTAAILGSILGKRVGDRLSAVTLARVFAALLLLVGASVAVQSVLAL